MKNLPYNNFNAATNRFLIASFAPAISPRLDIQLAGGAVVLPWTTSAMNFSLEQNSDLNPATWVAVTNAVSSAGTNNQVTNAPLIGNTFFRLTHP